MRGLPAPDLATIKDFFSILHRNELRQDRYETHDRLTPMLNGFLPALLVLRAEKSMKKIRPRVYKESLTDPGQTLTWPKPTGLAQPTSQPTRVVQVRAHPHPRRHNSFRQEVR